MATLPAGAAGSHFKRDRSVAVATVAALLILSSALLLRAVGDLRFTLSFAAGLAGVIAILIALDRFRAEAPVAAAPSLLDPALLHAALDHADMAAAISASDGKLLATNSRWGDWFSGAEPAILLEGGVRAEDLSRAALRDGHIALDPLFVGGRRLRLDVSRAGANGTHLHWRFSNTTDADIAREAEKLIGGDSGRRLGEAGIMAALVDPDGRLTAANRAFAQRAADREPTDLVNAALIDMIGVSEQGQFHFLSEGAGKAPLRLVQVPLAESGDPVTLFLLLDDPGAAPPPDQSGSGNMGALLDFVPFGLALVNADGRFIHVNPGFRKSAGVGAKARIVYPGDLVVDEDKAAVSDAVRRFARGPSASSDLHVRLKGQEEEPVALTVAGVRGLGDAAVILSLKDNSEADKLKRQVAQATKMQAVGQLAGGVAHDFNNILTAILGYCDLMLMRHSPGDSDYDDIQHIRSNSNRAASLTRQLLAFSRQQTLRPQILQLPDVIAEVSNLVKRLLGENVHLKVKHGRNLGTVRADPGQLEQVIVNLCVNARDAMPEGGTLTIETRAVPMEEARRLGSDVLPAADYTTLRISDTGTGIPPNLLGKIFEPFFTTKEVGKGTGLGLSTVYGIVKQSGGYIFAESEEGKGTSFTIYLPVHHSTKAPVKRKKAEPKSELWGTETILLVEDDSMVRTLAERALSRHGYKILAAENGEAALEVLEREGPVDLMISDVVMPTMDGPTTVREARKIYPDLPVLFISGYAEEQLRKSIDMANVAFLAKPFSVHKLAEAARDTLQGK